MPRLSRRDFLKLAGGAAASLPFARIPVSIAEEIGTSAALTTLERTIAKGTAPLNEGTNGAYWPLAYGPGEPHIIRTELGAASAAPIHCATAFVHFTDIHLIDAQSPARVEFLDRFADQECQTFPLSSAWRPQEALTVQVLESMIRRVNRITRGPATGRRFRFVMCTGDNVDNEQYNELRWFVDTMDGGSSVVPDSGTIGEYEGVQDAAWGDPEYWHPDPGTDDKYKSQWGYPEYPGLLERAVRPFDAHGVRLPWWQTYGNHDGLMQGNAPRNEAFNGVAIGPLKFDGPPPGLNPCNPFEGLGTDYLPTRLVGADPRRYIYRRLQYIDEMFRTTGTPRGHGFRRRNRETGVAYYVRDDVPHFRFIALDTVNPGGFSEGSIGAAQFAWLTEKLIEVSSSYYDENGNQVTTDNADRLVVLFSHHGLRSLTNPLQDPNPDDPASNDLPRILAPQVEALLHRFPNVIAWVDGHTHNNIIDPRPDPSGRTAGFWDIGTAAHVDWSCQSRLIEIAHREDGMLSIFCTMVDHAAPPDPASASGVLGLASVHRELAANDPQYGFSSKGPGDPEDRNVELLIPAPEWLRH